MKPPPFEVVRITYIFACGCSVSLPWEMASLEAAHHKHYALLHTGQCRGEAGA